MNLFAELENLRPALLRFAFLQLRQQSAAEDAVQETLLAVLEKPDAFQGNSSLRTYVTGILKFKVIDHLRSLQREQPLTALDDEHEADVIDSLFLQNGHTVQMPNAWRTPDTELEQQDFFRIMEMCLEKLPEKTARVFLMREWLDIDSEEICQDLGLSSSNLWVLLYRARLRLRECLDLHWFGNRS